MITEDKLAAARLTPTGKRPMHAIAKTLGVSHATMYRHLDLSAAELDGGESRRNCSSNPATRLLQSLHRTRQAKNHLNTTLPPRVVDRLRLGAIHNPKIRRITRRSLLWRPTSERLLKERALQGF